ncbi:C13 family peptidase [Bradyrhizobium sp. 2TAF24]|uniref:C13 family peptidase n=1 Tax=Bradyrhizobium sp. 2TAF24 TaxID=3233011 RepID=UPI003F90DE34
MRTIFKTVKLAGRAAVWRPTRDIPDVGARALLGWCFLYLTIDIATQYARSYSILTFDPYGLNGSIAFLAGYLAIVALFIPSSRRMVSLVALVVQGIMLALVVQLALRFFPDLQSWWRDNAPSWGWFLAFFAWIAGIYAALLRSGDNRPGWLRTLTISFGLAVAVTVFGNIFPYAPTFIGKDYNQSSFNLWEAIRQAQRRAAEGEELRRVDRAAVELAQARLMDAAIGGLKPQRPGYVDIYTIGAAGWSPQDVFLKELDGALGVLGSALDIEGRTLRLVNHPDTVANTPVASRQNFAAAVRAAAKTMDPAEDVLAIFLTSHGSSDGVALRLHGAFYGSLSPDDVAETLRAEGIRNRIIIVSACYSGIFLKPLADEHSIVITASDENNSSFGCSNEREWTYFGDALFNQSLQPGVDLPAAFAKASNLIAEWEMRDGLPASHPQAHFGNALLQKLAAAATQGREAAAGR